ncbi:MAG: P-II family nitrogen regulator [Planctomycetes bacterium]|nr:P-II family nitrogen regulator [Planctomycetota bacterium]
MKLVVAVIQPTKLQAVREGLANVEVERMTICDAFGYGRQRGRAALYRGVEYGAPLLRKAVLEIVVNDDFLERTIDTILACAVTGPEGQFGDGKIFVMPVDGVCRIHDGLHGKEAV